MANNQISKRKKKRKNMYVLTEICAFFSLKLPTPDVKINKIKTTVTPHNTHYK